MTKKTTLQFKEGNSDKTYEVWLEATPSGKSYKVNFAYGRTGGNLKAGTKTPRAVALEKAEEVFGKLVAEKKKKGYKAKRGKAPAKNKAVKKAVKKVAKKVTKKVVKKVVKKLRIRNYPSLALFHNGSKKKVWKADMDGVVDVTNKDIKKAISNAMAGDVF